MFQAKQSGALALFQPGSDERAKSGDGQRIKSTNGLILPTSGTRQRRGGMENAGSSAAFLPDTDTMQIVDPPRPSPFPKGVLVLGLGFIAVLFVTSSLIWWFVGIDPVKTALPKAVGLTADAVMAVCISLILWRMSHRRLGLQALAACMLSLPAAVLSAIVDRGLQIYMTRPEVPPFDPQYFTSVVTFTTAELFGWSCLYLALQYSARSRETERRLAEMRQQALTAQMRALQYQVNPHFLFNTLNSIAGLIEEGAHGPANDMVLQLAAFLRKTVTLDPLSDVTLGDEIALQRDYLAIEEARFSDRLKVTLRLQPGIGAARVPALILQPLVENAIKHGVARTPGQAELEIGAEALPGERMQIWVENPVPTGSDDASPPEGMGIGLRNVAARLAARHPERASCRTRLVAPGRLRVTLELPVQ